MRNLLVILLIFVISGCRPKEYGENHDKQIGAIESYVSKQGPYNIQGGVYVIVTQAGIAGAPIPANGDTITFNYTERLFTDKPQPTPIISTNDLEIATANKLDTPAELLVPKKVVWGTTPLIPGLRGALMWTTKGESIDAIVPFNLGYGDEWNGIVPPYSALAFTIDIIDIQKKK